MEKKPNWSNKNIFTGDNLPVMRGMNSRSVDLIYLDPPFNSKRDYAAPIGSKAAGAEFKDTWTLDDIDVEWINLIEQSQPALHRVLLAATSNSDKSYMVYMAVRLLEMHRVLKPTGSIYLHCDPTMGHYLKLMLDSVFGRKNFRNEIVWHYTGGGRSKSYFSKKHDLVFWYSVSHDQCTFNIDQVRVPYRESSGYAKSGIRHKNGKKYLPNPKGTPVDDVWAIPIINPMAKERTGYPTQKPLALLDRIIKASSNPGDVVFDPFCGCATTLVAADDLDRRWVGVDISPKAAELVVSRIEDRQGLFREIIHRTDIPKRTDLGNLPPAASPSNRKTLYGEQGGSCAGCQEHFQPQHLEVDHIIARTKGGTDHLQNLQLLCGHCNRIKGDRGMEYLRVKLGLS